MERSSGIITSKITASGMTVVVSVGARNSLSNSASGLLRSPGPVRVRDQPGVGARVALHGVISDHGDGHTLHVEVGGVDVPCQEMRQDLAGVWGLANREDVPVGVVADGRPSQCAENSATCNNWQSLQLAGLPRTVLLLRTRNHLCGS